MLRITTERFHDQVVEAITSIKEIYTLKNVPLDPKLSRELITQQLLTDPSINFRDIPEVDKIITQDEETNRQPSNFDIELDNLTVEYDTALEIFQNLENIDYGSSRIVSQSAQPARCLTVKMLLLAKQIQERPPKPNNPQRVLISVKLQQLRKLYNSPNSSLSAEEIKRQVAEQIDEWLKVNAFEQAAIEDTTTKLLIAADTGRQLSKLIDDYSSVNFEVIASRVTQIMGLTTSITRRNYSSTQTKLKNIERLITEDKTLREFMTEVSFKRPQSQTSKSPLCQQL
ncbi:hypothetical protein ACN23B_16900 [Anabaena sp. FACHB-709]|uniref:Uncharacterized protein n=2 Tax=Nostocaceae TaxID=1162 RepID=A0A1Z4KJ40_ANAVA|nr:MULTISPECIES: hypothetical protein [Nostocaceae]BAY68995.1 hypothetical protein NIES23_17850 [Trichormus variabilis NIES-23]HBW33088.1 hypothetical protein [Nostoc sp. UBA8866]MBD2170564.1 hypothetical protein [Anabaena cylindrica FACHB-318]MBD2261959.1 hypothetical protein [Anabaena sp. FACHB-709]MBD2271898.1 hypothetical protein [Nostoc sp. PCC 7120 = FACHB-418]